MFDFIFDTPIAPILLAACAVGGVLAWRSQAADFTIDSRPGRRVRIHGRIPASKHGAIRSFFANDLNGARAVKVRGSFGPKRGLRLRIAGRVSPGDQQRIRNFLMSQLR